MPSVSAFITGGTPDPFVDPHVDVFLVEGFRCRGETAIRQMPVRSRARVLSCSARAPNIVRWVNVQAEVSSGSVGGGNLFRMYERRNFDFF